MDAAAMLPVKKQDSPQIPHSPPHLPPLPKKEKKKKTSEPLFPASRLVLVLFSQGQMVAFYFVGAAMNLIFLFWWKFLLRASRKRNLGHGGNAS